MSDHQRDDTATAATDQQGRPKIPGIRQAMERVRADRDAGAARIQQGSLSREADTTDRSED